MPSNGNTCALWPHGPCIKCLCCAQICYRRLRWPCDLEVRCLWPYCYEALNEVPWVVCMKTSRAVGLLWSVCDMVCNYETPDIDCSIWCYLWDYCATHSFVHVPLSHTDQWHFWTIQPMNSFGDIPSDCCKPCLQWHSKCRLFTPFCQNQEWNWNYLAAVTVKWTLSLSSARLTFNMCCTFWSDEFTCVSPKYCAPKSLNINMCHAG